MTSNRRGSRPRAALALAAIALAACAVGCSNGGGGPKRFDRFVKDEIANTSETTQPTEINGRKFRFDEDPGAFDELFE